MYRTDFNHSAGNEVKANTAYTRAQECLFIVGNLNILQSPRIGSEGRVEFVLESLRALQERKAFKNFTSEVPPEILAGVVFEESEIASRDGLLTKGSRARDPKIDDENDLAKVMNELVLSDQTQPTASGSGSPAASSS